MQTKKVTTNVNLSPKLYEQLRTKSIKDGISASEIIRNALTLYFKQNGE